MNAFSDQDITDLSSLKCIVQKYGGTSMGSAERIDEVAERIVAWQKKCPQAVISVVVSAMAGETNRLLGLIRGIDPEVNDKFSDLCASAGEQVSVALLCAMLQKKGVVAEPFLGFQLKILTDGCHSKAKINSIDTAPLKRVWEKNPQTICVIAGFQGMGNDQAVTTLGRGGSDTSAVAMACALSADLCEINTDVDGFYTADPRKTPNAKRIDAIDSRVALEMAALGSKVLHPRCVELAAKYDLKMVVRNTFSKNYFTGGTMVRPWSEKEAMEAPVVSGVSVEKGICCASIRIVDEKTGIAFLPTLFKLLAEESINIDIIIQNTFTSGGHYDVGFSINQDQFLKTKKVLDGFVKEHPEQVQVQLQQNLSKVSIVGLGMTHNHGVASQMFSSLSAAGIDTKMISTSEIKISCVVSEDVADKASTVLHQAFIEV